MQGTFQESIDGIADLTAVSKRSLEDLLVDAARDFDVIRNASRRWPPAPFGGGGRW